MLHVPYYLVMLGFPVVTEWRLTYLGDKSEVRRLEGRGTCMHKHAAACAERIMSTARAMLSDAPCYSCVRQVKQQHYNMMHQHICLS